MKTSLLLGPLFALVVIAASSGAASAHHSQPGFNPNDKPVELKGLVAEFRWRNPHVLLLRREG
jgi:hypothetical protein